jgi:P27 family predicted phage terminase small subunit
MAKGRKSLPTQTKIARSTDQPVRMNYSEAEYEKITKVSVPRILNNARAKRIYRERAQVLINQGILMEPDADLLVAYANTLDLYYQTMEEQGKKGFAMVVDVETKKGTISMVNPYMKLQKELLEMTTKLAAHFGFSPSTRASLRLQPKEQQNSLEDFLRR